MEIRQLGRRQFVLQSAATFSTALISKACRPEPPVADELTDSDFGDTSLSLQSISVPPANGQAPTALIVCLHGFGANLHDLAPLAPALKLPDYQFLFPDAPLSHPGIPGGRMWYDLYSQDYRGLTSSRQQLLDWLKSLESSTGIPLSRTILSGFSQGGAMTLDVGLTLPFAGLVSLSGYLHSTPQPAAGDALPPVLMVHGRQDQVVLLGAAQRARDTLTALGVVVKYQEFDMGHEIVPAELELMRSFAIDCLA